MGGLPDLSSLTEEQRTAVAYLAQREAATLIARVLTGANERLHLALGSGIVELPIFHLEDIAQIERIWAPGKETHVTGGGQ